MSDEGEAASNQNRWSAVLRIEHAGVMLTLGYIGLIMIGLLHESWVLLFFRVNILQYADPSDFVLAPARDPLLTVATIVPVIGGALYARAGMRLSAKLKARKSRWASNTQTPPWAWVAMTLLWVVAVSMYYSRYVAREIKAGHGRAVRVSYVVPPAVADTNTTYLVATTGRALFLYRLADRTTEIVPLSNVSRIVIAPRAK